MSGRTVRRSSRMHEQKVRFLSSSVFKSVRSSIQHCFWWLPSILQRTREGRIRNQHPEVTEAVIQVANALCATMAIWEVEATPVVKASLAYWHRTIQTYRGYVLCSNSKGATVLIDTLTWTYLQGSALHLLQIDGVEQAKAFIDALCDSLHVQLDCKECPPERERGS